MPPLVPSFRRFVLTSALDAFATNPLPDVWCAISEFNFLVLAVTEKVDRRKINENNLRQIENDWRSLMLKLFAEFFDAI